MIMGSGKSPLRLIHAVEMNPHLTLSLFRIRFAGVLPSSAPSSAAAMFLLPKTQGTLPDLVRPQTRCARGRVPGTGALRPNKYLFPKGERTLCGGHRVRVTE